MIKKTFVILFSFFTAICATSSIVLAADAVQKDINQQRNLPAKKNMQQRDLPGRGANKIASKQRDLPGRGTNKDLQTQRDLPRKTVQNTPPVNLPTPTLAKQQAADTLVTGGILLAQADTSSSEESSTPAHEPAPAETNVPSVEKTSVPLSTPAPSDEAKKPAEYNAFIDLTSKPPAPETTVEGQELTGDDLGNDTVKVKMKTDEEIKPKTSIDEFAGPAAKEAADKKAATELTVQNKNGKEPITTLKNGIEKDEGFFAKLLARNQAQGARPGEIDTKPERAGYQRFYKQGLGFRVTDFLSVSSRVELFQEPIPVESLMFGLYQTAWYTKPWPETDTHLADKWSKSDARNAVRHAYTRAYAWQGILHFDPKLPSLRYTYDRRDLLREFDETVNGFKELMQETHEVMLEYATPFKIPYVGQVVINPGYQRVRFAGQGNPYASEDRDKYLFHWLFKHNDYFNTFMGYERYQGKARNTPWIMKPEQNRFMVEERIWYPKHKLSIIPGYYYGRTNYRPDPAHFILHEAFVEFNKDWTSKLRMTQRQDLKWGEIEHIPNSWVDWEKDIYSPPRLKAQSLKERVKFSYEIIPHLDVSTEVNWSTGLGYTYFDNIGGLWELELFHPGVIRIRVGYFYNLYYRLQTHAEGFQFRAFAFE